MNDFMIELDVYLVRAINLRHGKFVEDYFNALEMKVLDEYDNRGLIQVLSKELVVKGKDYKWSS